VKATPNASSLLEIKSNKETCCVPAQIQRRDSRLLRLPQGFNLSNDTYTWFYYYEWLAWKAVVGSKSALLL